MKTYGTNGTSAVGKSLWQSGVRGLQMRSKKWKVKQKKHISNIGEPCCNLRLTKKFSRMGDWGGVGQIVSINWNPQARDEMMGKMLWNRGTTKTILVNSWYWGICSRHKNNVPKLTKIIPHGASFFLSIFNFNDTNICFNLLKVKVPRF